MAPKNRTITPICVISSRRENFRHRIALLKRYKCAPLHRKPIDPSRHELAATTSSSERAQTNSPPRASTSHQLISPPFLLIYPLRPR